VQPVTELARAVLRLDASLDGSVAASATAVAVRAAETAGAAFARRYAYGLGLSHALSERLDDARAPLLAALDVAQTPRQRAMALGALAMIAAREGRTDETFVLAERADAAAREAGMAPPIAMQRARAEVLAATWKLAEASTLFLEVASRAPRDDTAWATAAMTFGGAGDTYAALDASRRGLAVQPRDADLLRVQALSLQVPTLGVDSKTRAAAEAAFLERRTPDAAPAIRGACSANVPGCANERIPVHVHAMRQR
jgi:tetratricopeptide (TPR) repeat protein